MKQSKRAARTVQGWCSNDGFQVLQDTCKKLEETNKVWKQKNQRRKIGWGSSVKTFFPTLCLAFLKALETVITVDKKKSIQYMSQHL